MCHLLMDAVYVALMVALVGVTLLVDYGIYQSARTLLLALGPFALYSLAKVPILLDNLTLFDYRTAADLYWFFSIAVAGGRNISCLSAAANPAAATSWSAKFRAASAPAARSWNSW